MTMTERAIKEYTNEYMWACFYGYILDMDLFNLDDYYAEEIREKKQRHAYTLSTVARCFSLQSSRKYLPDAREKAVLEAHEMYQKWVQKFYKTGAES